MVKPPEGFERLAEEYPFEPKSLELGSNRMSYIDEGEGRPVVMLHGNPTWSFYYRNLVLGMRDRYRVLAPDHIGCGLSSKPQDYDYCLQNHINNLEKLIEHTGLDDITLVMHDWGGSIGMGYAVQHPEKIKRLVIFNTAAFLSSRIPLSINLCKTPLLGEFIVRGLNGFVGPAVRLNYGTNMPERFTDAVRRGYLFPYRSWRDRIAIHRFVRDIPMKKSHRTWELMKSIEEKLHLFRRIPVQIIWGMKDFCFNEHFLKRWTEIFPSAELHRLEDAGHFVVEDAHEKIIPLMLDFLEKSRKAGKNWNIAVRFSGEAKKSPKKTAVVHQNGEEYASITFEELERKSNRLADGFSRMGITNGTRTLVMIRPGIPFVTVAFALFKAGAVPVFIDPGMGVTNLANCVRQIECSAFIGVTQAHMMRLFFKKEFKSIDKLVTIGQKFLWGGETYDGLLEKGADIFSPVFVEKHDTAAIIFTTGSTGPPKGVVYTHGMFNTQLDIIRENYSVTGNDVDLSAFPLFALFAVALGMKSVIPDMDPTRPAKVNPSNIVNAVNRQGVTFTFGSPAIWEKVSAWCVEKDLALPSLARVLMAGAPVSEEIHRRLLTGILPENGETHTPYGATEALPIADITGAEVLKETASLTAQGKGICVGRPVKWAEIKVIRLSDDAISEWNESFPLKTGEIGEIVVRGDMVSPAYYGLPEKNRLAKIRDDKKFWHRMGDAGYFDEKGRLWFCGRKDHRVATKNGILYSVRCEAVFNAHPAVFRTALVGIGDRPNQRPVIIAELKKGEYFSDKRKIKEEILALGAENRLTADIGDLLFHPEFPTDIRHNAKIFREKLKVWAEDKLPPTEPQ